MKCPVCVANKNKGCSKVQIADIFYEKDVWLYDEKGKKKKDDIFIYMKCSNGHVWRSDKLD